MIAMIFQLLGGIGLFLLGMVMLTDGLKAFAGEALRRALVRFTGTPAKAFSSGALVTLAVQSSSATTVTVIGFVSAGLLTFPQAVGVVMGASLGTTGTGWIVSILGLKISLGFYALPLVGIGALCQLLLRGRGRPLGIALAGFGLIFIGIDTLQQGMGALSSYVPLSQLPAQGLLGHLAAMLIGIVMTVLMQSSSAAVATTLTALHVGAINFEQASSLVIGAAVGTTVTGALAAIGGSVPAKRTALAHVLFNSATGLIAVVLLPVFLIGISWAQEHLGLDPGATSLAAFHTAFIALGVVIFLPFVDRFCAWIERLLPDRGPVLTAHLDDSLLLSPAVALEATQRALKATAREVISSLQGVIGQPAGALRSDGVGPAIERIQSFFARIPPINDTAPISVNRVAQIHSIDHLSRLHNRLTPSATLRRFVADPRLAHATDLARTILSTAHAGLGSEPPEQWLPEVEQGARRLADLRRDGRATVLEQTAQGVWTPAEALEVLDTVRWLDRIGYHTARLSHHLGRTPEQAEAAGQDVPESAEDSPL